MLKQFIFCISCIFIIQLCALQEFIYPVGVITHNGKQKICVQYQKNSHLELWFWDPQTQEAVKGLLSSFTPADVKVIPYQSAFSFIDNDRIRIKDAKKRSPSTLDLPYGPYDLTTLEWIDSESFYFSAHERDHVALFHANKQGELFHLIRSSEKDYSYPQKVGEWLFYLCKHENSTTIERAPYPLKSIPRRVWSEKHSFHDQLECVYQAERDLHAKTYIDASTQEKLYLWDDKDKEPAFLTMVDASRGYFLAHPLIVGKNDYTMTFDCYRFLREPKPQVEKIFSFDVPLYLLMPQHNQPDRLYESIMPLLPRYYADSIYYCHDEGMGLQLYRYDEKTGEKQQLTEADNTHHFAPLLFNNVCYYGGSVFHDEHPSNIHPQMWITEHGEQKFYFPVL